MNEVEKMYENCNIKPKQKGYCDWDSNCPYPHHKCNDECPYWKHEDIAKYPPFTAEKQIEIIKFLISKYAMFKKFRSYEQKDLYMVCYECRYFPKQYLPFEEALAESINHLWQDLTEEERKQIKEILE